MEQEFAYNGFLSYSHGDQTELAADIQRALHSIARPWYRARALRIFRDKSSITPSASLWREIQAALETAEFFILLASPGAAQSPWVGKEVEWWIQNRGTDKFVLIVGSGGISWDLFAQDFDRIKTNSIPQVLFGRFADEPLWVDVSFAAVGLTRPMRDRLHAELLPVAARMHHKAPDVLGGEDIRRRRTNYAVVFSLMLVSVLALTGGFFVARESKVEKAMAQRRAEEQALRAEKERLDRVAGLAYQLAANGGISVTAVAQLAEAARRSSDADAQRHRIVLGYWFQLLAPVTELLAKNPLAMWADKAFFLDHGRLIEFSGNRKSGLVLSRHKELIYAIESEKGTLVVFDRHDGREIARVDISELSLEEDEIDLFELADGNVLLVSGTLQSEASLTSRDQKILIMRTDGQGKYWLGGSDKYSPNSRFRISRNCRSFHALVDETVDDKQRLTKQWVDILDNGELRTGQSIISSAEVGDEGYASLLEEPVGNYCDKFKASLQTNQLEFPLKRPESDLWSIQKKPASFVSRLVKMAGYGEEPPEMRPITPKESKHVRAQLANLKPSIQRLVDIEDPKKTDLKNLVYGPALDLSLGLGFLEEFLEDSPGRISVIDTSRGPVYRNLIPSGARFGDYTFCRVADGLDGTKCISYRFHGEFGASLISPDSKYLVVADWSFAGHNSFGVLDLLRMESIAIQPQPFNTIVAADFDVSTAELAILSPVGEVLVYSLTPHPSLVARFVADVKRQNREMILGDGDLFAPCFRLINGQVMYCNTAGGITAVSIKDSVVAWDTAGFLRPSDVPVLVVSEQDGRAIVYSDRGFRLMRTSDGVFLSDWVDAKSIGKRIGSKIEGAGFSKDGREWINTGGRWYARKAPLNDEQVKALLSSTSCLTGLEEGAAIRRSSRLRCDAE